MRGEQTEHGGLVSGQRPRGQDADSLVAHFVAVTERAVQHISAPSCGQTGHVGQFIAPAGGNDDPLRCDRPISRLERELANASVDRTNRTGDESDAVAFCFGPSQPAELGWWCSVAGQEVVYVTRGRVARVSGIDDDHRASEAGEGDRGAESCGSAADHGDVVEIVTGNIDVRHWGWPRSAGRTADWSAVLLHQR